MNIRMSVQNLTFRSPDSLFFKSTVNLLFLCMFLNNAKRELQKNVRFRVENSAKNSCLLLCLKPV